MGIFDIFKKREEPLYDSTNIEVKDLNVGFVFDYDLSSWEVIEAYRYDWGDNYFSMEYKVNNGESTRYLSVEEDDEVEISLVEKIKVGSINRTLNATLCQNQEPPQELVYNGVVYYLEGERSGYFNDIARGSSWEEMREWSFEDESGKQQLTIEQWDDKEFEASSGVEIKEFEISNILPSGKR